MGDGVGETIDMNARQKIITFALGIFFAMTPILSQGGQLLAIVHAAGPQCSGSNLEINNATNASDFSQNQTATYRCANTVTTSLGDNQSTSDTTFTFYNSDWGPPVGSTNYDPIGNVTVKDQNGKTIPPNIKCSTLTDYFINMGTCLGRSLSAIIGSLLITVAAWLLEAIGLLFNYLTYYTIITFGNFNSTGVSGLVNFTNNINVGWGLFRDLSNIVIIGLFTFISISIILGLKEYGAKKMVARVLIIAVLINFSLLFTKIIVDASNFTAYQFYNAAKLNGTDTPTGAFNLDTYSQFSQSGVAGELFKFMGITGLSNTFNLLQQGADTQQNGWIILLHGLFAATMLLGVALVLLYGSFLLLTRAIMIIILMLTASIAFATHLVPALDKRGWSLWWESLINVAVFAPVLMIFLWITLMLAKSLAPTNGGTLGALVGDPTGSSNLSALFSYIMILGLLYASFKISSTFASMASGISFAGMAAGALALATGGVTGLAGRALIGKSSAGGLASLQQKIEDRKAAGGKDASRFERARMQTYASLSKATFDPTKTKLGAAATKGAPGSSLFKDAGKGGFVGVKDRQAAAGIKKAAAIAPSADQVKAAIEKQQEAENDTLKAAIDSGTANLASAQANKPKAVADVRATQTERPDIEQKLEVHKSEQETDAQTRQKEIADHASNMNDIKRRIDRARTAVERQELDTKRTAAESGHSASINLIDAKMSARANEMKTVQGKLDQLNQSAEATVDATISSIKKDISTAKERQVELASALAKAGNAAKETKVNLGKIYAHQRLSTLYGLVGSVENDAASKRVGGALKKHDKQEEREAYLKIFKGDEHGAEEKKS